MKLALQNIGMTQTGKSNTWKLSDAFVLETQKMPCMQPSIFLVEYHRHWLALPPPVFQTILPPPYLKIAAADGELLHVKLSYSPPPIKEMAPLSPGTQNSL